MRSPPRPRPRSCVHFFIIIADPERMRSGALRHKIDTLAVHDVTPE
jgi:hypothetical protein